MKVIAIGNQKGGVSKTATVHNVGAVLSAEMGLRVLLVDLDPQSSLTEACGIESRDDQHIGLCLLKKSPVKLSEILVQSEEGFTVAPAHEDLAGVEAMMFTETRRESRLRAVLRSVEASFDICLIDCPPSLSMLTVNALAAADRVLIPTQAQIQDVRGLTRFLTTIDEIAEGGQDAINQHLEVLGIVPTFYDSRLTHHNAILDALSDFPLLDVRIGRSIRIAESAAAGRSILDYDPHNKQLGAYRALAQVIQHG